MCWRGAVPNVNRDAKNLNLLDFFWSRCSDVPVVDASGCDHFAQKGTYLYRRKQPTSTLSSSITTTPFSSRRHSTLQTLVNLQNQLQTWHNFSKARLQTNHSTERNPPKTSNSTLPHTHLRLYLATQHLHKLLMDMVNRQARRAMDLEGLILGLEHQRGE